MAKHAGGGLSGLPVGLAAWAPASGGSRGGGLLDMLAPMLDRDRDGSMVDDVDRHARQACSAAASRLLRPGRAHDLITDR